MKYAAAAVLIGLSLLALAGHPLISPDALAAAAPLFMIGDIESLGRLIQDQGEAWEEYKRTNDALIRAKADGKAVGDLEAKLSRLSSAIDAMSNILGGLQVKGLGLGGGSASDGDIATETKAFNAIRRSYSDGKAVADISVGEYSDYKGAFFSWARKGRLDSLTDSERKAMLAGDDPNGGYLLPPSTIGRVVARIFELSPIRAIASVQPISTMALEGVYDNDEIAYGWVSETGARPTTTTPALGKYRIEAFEMYTDPKATQTLLDDAAVDVEGWLARKVADKFARVEGSAFINGTGVGQPRGFATYTLVATADATRAWGSIEKLKTTANGDFASSNPGDVLFDLIAAMKAGYTSNAQFVTTRAVIAKIRKFKEATTNAYIWQPGLQKGNPDTLLGYPIVIAQDIPALTTGSASLWFGDWAEAYQIVDRLGIRTLRDPYTDKPYVHFYSTRRVGGAVVNFEAIKAITFEA
jgi:HK97 family phage major capsid protein